MYSHGAYVNIQKFQFLYLLISSVKQLSKTDCTELLLDTLSHTKTEFSDFYYARPMHYAIALRLRNHSQIYE
jgi:hypothetical protein